MQTFKAKYNTLEKQIPLPRAPSLPGGILEGIHSLKLPGWDVPSQTLPGGDPPHAMVTCMRMLCICVCLRKTSDCLRRVLRAAHN